MGYGNVHDVSQSLHLRIHWSTTILPYSVQPTLEQRGQDHEQELIRMHTQASSGHSRSPREGQRRPPVTFYEARRSRPYRPDRIFEALLWVLVRRSLGHFARRKRLWGGWLGYGRTHNAFGQAETLACWAIGYLPTTTTC